MLPFLTRFGAETYFLALYSYIAPEKGKFVHLFILKCAFLFVLERLLLYDLPLKRPALWKIGQNINQLRAVAGSELGA